MATSSSRVGLHRSVAFAAAVLVVGALGIGIGVRITDGDHHHRAEQLPVATVNITLPIRYPAGDALPDLGETPGPLAAIWLAPRSGATTIEIVALRAESGTFGTLPLDLPQLPDDPENPVPAPWVALALSPDGRKIAYSLYPEKRLAVRDLVTGEVQLSTFDFDIATLEGWSDNIHVFGVVEEAVRDGDGWVWEPGSAPDLVDFYGTPHGKSGLSIPLHGGTRRHCRPPVLQDVRLRAATGGGWSGAFEVPVLCRVLGITDDGSVLGRARNEHDGTGTVVALDIDTDRLPIGADQLAPARLSAAQFRDAVGRRVVVVRGGPERVTFATALIARALARDSRT